MMASLFEEFSIYFEHEQEIKEEIRKSVREIEQTGRNLNLILSKIHQNNSADDFAKIISESENILKTSVRSSFQKLASSIPEGQYFRFHQVFCHSIQREVYFSALTLYLKEERLITKAEASEWLGIQESGNFFLDLEDYLSGLTQLSNELSRFTVNSVTHGDYSRPKRIAGFLGDLLRGFRLLNLKNDNLRKKFDSLKYDLKKVEEVVYDLSIRGLLKTDDDVHPPKEVAVAQNVEPAKENTEA